VFKVIKLCKTGYVTVREVGFKEAVRLARKGVDIKAPRKSEANKVADAVNGGAGKPGRDQPHGNGMMPHYHPNPRTGGHIFYGIAAGLTVSHYFEGCECMMEKAAPIVDFFSPLSIPQDIVDLVGSDN
jgi:hypothetical protein